MQPDYSSSMPMSQCMNCPYMMQGQCPYMGMMGMGTPFMGESYMQPGQYPGMQAPEMKREDVEENGENYLYGEEDQYRHFPMGPFGRPRPFFPRPFFRPFFPPFFFPPFFFPPFFFPFR